MDKIVRDSGSKDNPPKFMEDYIEELINKVNEIVDWINKNG